MQYGTQLHNCRTPYIIKYWIDIFDHFTACIEKLSHKNFRNSKCKEKVRES